MKTLYFDMNSGISGDMALASLFCLGADPEAFSEAASRMVGAEIKLSLETVMRSGIKCSRLKIENGEIAAPFRSLSDLRRMVVGSPVAEKVKSDALKTLRIIAEAESEIHGIPLEDVHFHEIGAVDTIIDAVGVAWALNELEVEKVIACTPVFGHGVITTAHGTIPLPAPATLRILKDVPVKRLDVEGELTTPTGAAILKTYASEFSMSFHGQVGDDCFVTGTKEFDGVPNFMRAVLFDDSRAENKDEVLLMKTNIDDMSGENFGFLLDTLMDIGALDVSYSPAYGKKNRPFYMITVMLPKDREKEIAKVIFRYSTTAGIRVQTVDRLVMAREITTVDIEGEPVRVKRLYYDEIEKFCPEWDDCVRVSKKIITTPIDVHCRATLVAAQEKE